MSYWGLSARPIIWRTLRAQLNPMTFLWAVHLLCKKIQHICHIEVCLPVRSIIWRTLRGSSSTHQPFSGLNTRYVKKYYTYFYGQQCYLFCSDMHMLYSFNTRSHKMLPDIELELPTFASCNQEDSLHKSGKISKLHVIWSQIYKGDPRTCAIFIPAWGSYWGIRVSPSLDQNKFCDSSGTYVLLSEREDCGRIFVRVYFHDFSKKYTLFYDSQGLTSENANFCDFLGFPWPARTL